METKQREELHFTGIKDVDKQILLTIRDEKDFIETCSLNSYFKDKVCDDALYERRLKTKYPLLVNFKNTRAIENWKNFYLRMVYYIAKIQEKYQIPYIPSEKYNPESFYKHYQMLEGAEIFSKDKIKKDLYNEAMEFAGSAGDVNIVKLLMNKGATDIDSTIIAASQNGHLNVVKFLIDSVTSENILNSVLSWAAFGGHLDIVKLSIEKGANNFNLAMYNSAFGGYTDIVKLMLEKGANNFNVTMEDAAAGGHLDIVKLMVEHGATKFDRAIKAAEAEGHIDVVNYLTPYLKQFIK